MDLAQLHKLKFHLARLGRDPHGAAAQDWARVIELTQELLRAPVLPQLQAFRQSLEREAAFLLAGRLPSNFLHLQHQLQAAIQTFPKESQAKELAPRSDVERLADLLRGREIVVIGGDPRQQHRERLRDSLRLSEVHWPQTREDRPDVGALEPLIARSEVVLVLLLIRWIRHALGDVGKLCERHDKALARITAGYHANKIAHEVLAQCAERLEEV
jgi:hypothetical protein